MDNIGKYKIQRRLPGGTSEVYQGYDPKTDRKVLLKLLKEEQARNPDFVARFKQEAKAMGKVNSRYVATLFDADEYEGRAYLVMEYLEGEDLDEKLRRLQKLDEPMVCRILSDAARGLKAIHSEGIVHRDVKPANIFVEDRGNAKIIDLGIARLNDSDLTQVGTELGTPLYMSPEQWLGGKVDARADVYSLGIVAYRAVTGLKPHGEGATRDQVSRWTLERDFQPSWPDDVSPGFRRFVEDCTRRNPDERPENMARLVQRLESMQSTEDKTVVRLPGPNGRDQTLSVPLPETRAGMRRWMAVGGGLAVLILSAWIWNQNAVTPRAARVPPLPTSPQPGAVRTNTKDGLVYVWVPPGRIRIGTVEGARDRADTREREESFPKGFWMGRTEVPQDAFERLLGQQRNFSHFRNPELPVETVNWSTAAAYCEAAGARLPTSVEFEYASRAGTQQDRYGPIGEIAWYKENSEGKTHVVGKGKAPNAWGLFDMLGNVNEWTGTPGPQRSYYLRGGTFDNSKDYVRAALEHAVEPEYADKHLGFRCVLLEE